MAAMIEFDPNPTPRERTLERELEDMYELLKDTKFYLDRQDIAFASGSRGSMWNQLNPALRERIDAAIAAPRGKS